LTLFTIINQRHLYLTRILFTKIILNMAIIPAPLLNQKYPLHLDDREITLTVLVGNGQMYEGRYRVRPNLKSPDTRNGTLESGIPVSLGKDTELYGQRLSVLVTVATVTGKDTQAQFMLSGGQNDFNATLKVEAGNKGDTVVYEAYFRFTKS
jgi:hypothetical protein